MTSLLGRLVGRLVKLRDGEATTALLMFAYSFLAMTAYNILKPITRSKFIAALGADNLPYVQLVAGVLIGVLMQLYSGAIGRLPRRSVIPVTQAGLVGLLVVFWALFRTGGDWVSVAFYVLGLVLGLLLISQFWTLANDIYDPRQAKRLFGFIGGGASLGGATGAALTALAVDEVGTNNLLLVSAAVLGVCVVIVTVIVKRQPIAGAFAPVEEHGVGSGEAIRLLGSSRHLQVIALVIGFAALGAAIVDQQLNMAVEAINGASATDAITGFLAQVTFYLSVIGFVVQVGLTSRIHRSLGLLFALLVLPASLGITGMVILLNGALWAPAAARVVDTSLRYTLDKTTREVLFLPLPADLKFRAKLFVDVTTDRFAKALGALLLLVLIKPWGLGLTWQRLSYASLIVTGLWIFAAMLARREYLRAFRRGIDTRAIAPATVRLDVADAATVEALVEELASRDDTRVLYAVDMLEAVDKRNLITPLLLHHDSARVRARALVALESVRSSVSAHWTPAVERLLGDEDADVRAAAVHALATLRKEDLSTLMRPHLDDASPRVAVTAAAVLADYGCESDVHAAEAALNRLIEDPRGAAASARQAVAAALARVKNPRFRPLLVILMGDSDIDVAREAIRSARAMVPIDRLFVPGLIARLGHRTLKPAAREVLVSYGEEVLDSLAYFLHDRDESVWVRRHIPATLALLPTQRSMDVLVGALDDTDGFLRYKVVAALEKLRRDHPRLNIPRGSIEALVLKEGSRYCNYLTLRYNLLQRDADSRRSLLARALEEKLGRTLDRIYRLLGLIYAWKDVAAARYTIEHQTGRSRAGAVEYLDNLLGGAIRKRIMPIIEDLSMEGKVRHANVVLKSRPRDLEETLVQLVHDDDLVVAASAIHFVDERCLWSMAGDLEYIVAHNAAPGWVFEAASWALAAQRLAERPHDLWTDPLPVVELANRLRAIPLFDCGSVDELFRIAVAARQVRHEAGRELYHEGAPAEDVQFLLEGSVRLSGSNTAPADLDSPAALAFEEVLEGRPLGHTICAVDRTVSVALAGDEFLTMLSDNIELAQGLFRMLLDGRARQGRTDYIPPPHAGQVAAREPLQSIDKVLRLRQHPLLRRATVSQLLDLVAVTRDTPLGAGSVLFAEADQPAVYHVLTGEVCLEYDGATGRAPIVAGPGATIGLSETLAGVSLGRRATVTRDGHALRIGHDDLFEVLADHIELLQGLFSGVLNATRSETELDQVESVPVLGRS